MENEKQFKVYSFTLPLDLAQEFDKYLETNYKKTSPHVKELIVSDLRQLNLI